MADLGWPTFTVIDVFRHLDLEPDPEDTWAAGARLRDMYEDAAGKLPDKALRPKTSGTGSHCFAVYPPKWWDKAVEIVMLIADQKARQPRLL